MQPPGKAARYTKIRNHAAGQQRNNARAEVLAAADKKSRARGAAFR
jgi:hypothetical protein